MAATTDEFELALRLVRSIDLPHPDGQLLECFIEDSVDPAQAARYILQRCLAGEEILDVGSFLSDWKQLINKFAHEGPTHQLNDKAVISNITKRDRGRCCITGLGNSLWDPLIVAPVLPARKIHVNENLHEILDAFVGSDLRGWVLSPAAFLDVYQSHWLVRKSASAALSEGFFQFAFRKGLEYSVTIVRIGGPGWPSIVEKTPALRRDSFTDSAVSCADNVDPSALQIVSRFAKPIRWTLVAQEIARKRPKRVLNFPLASIWNRFSEWGIAAIMTGWRFVPASIRIRAYLGLASLGLRMYGQSCSSSVQRLPFGVYLKVTSARDHASVANECAAIQNVRRYTNIPVPRVLDLASNSVISCLLTTRVSGIPLGWCIDTLSDTEAAALLCDLQGSIAEMRAIPKLVAPEYAITNALGTACYDHRINAGLNYDEVRGNFVGPFVNEDEFNNVLRLGALPNVSHRSGHQIVFTHGDLNMRNVLMHNGKLSAIVDWENSGWYPEYWDYAKAHYITKLHQRWLKITDKVFERFGDYSAEMSTERQLWYYCY